MRDQDEEGSTPLLLGVGSGTTKVVEMLLENKATIRQNSQSQHIACVLLLIQIWQKRSDEYLKA